VTRRLYRWISWTTTFAVVTLAFCLWADALGLKREVYVLQPEAPAAPADLAATSFDLVVMDYSADGGAAGEFTAQQVADLKASGKVVLAYLSIGEAEVGRFYWDPSWIDGGPGDPDAPSWLGPFNPDFPDNFKVRYWMSAWQQLIFGTALGPNRSYLDRIVDQGFDGIYLDIIDAFFYWSEEQVEVSRAFARGEMIDLVAALAQYARDTRGVANFLLVPQNGIDIVLDGNDLLDTAGAGYLATIDGVGVEDVFYDETTPVAPAEVAFRLAVLADYLDSGGDQRLVLSVDYVWNGAAPGGAANVARYNDYHLLARAQGYLTYAAWTDRDLNEILAVEPTGGFTFGQPVPDPALFLDGFESGDTAAWSAVTP